MSPEKWQATKDKVQSVFKNAEFSIEKLEEPERGTIEILEFFGPMGKMRLEYSTKPLVIDKQVSGARRIGSHHEVKYIYSDTEVSHALKAYKWDADNADWLEIDMKDSFSL